MKEKFPGLKGLKIMKYVNKRVNILIIFLILLLIIYTYIYPDTVRKIIFPIHCYEKYSFTDKEISSISDAINIQCHAIEKMYGVKARINGYDIYILDFEEQDLCKNYIKSTDSYYGIIYTDKAPDTRYNSMDYTICYFEEYDDNQDVLVVKVRGYNYTLSKVVKKKSTHTIL